MRTDGFRHLETFDEAPETVQSLGVYADAQWCKITWLEELASERNTIQAQEDIMSARVMASNIRQKLYILLGWLFDHISGLINSFGLSSFVASDMVSLLPWNAAGSPRKSI